MNNNPLNLAIRFLLEIALVIIFAIWGWNKFNGISKFVFAVGLPLIAAVMWAVFKVDGEPGKAIVPIPGWLRLFYEILLFVFTSYFLFQMQYPKLAYAFIAVSAIHYLVSYDRIIWLLKN